MSTGVSVDKGTPIAASVEKEKPNNKNDGAENPNNKNDGKENANNKNDGKEKPKNKIGDECVGLKKVVGTKGYTLTIINSAMGLMMMKILLCDNPKISEFERLKALLLIYGYESGVSEGYLDSLVLSIRVVCRSISDGMIIDGIQLPFGKDYHIMVGCAK